MDFGNLNTTYKYKGTSKNPLKEYEDLASGWAISKTQREDAEKKKRLDELAALETTEAAKSTGDPLTDTYNKGGFGGFLAGAAGFVKDAAVDVYKKGEEAVTGIGKVGIGQIAGNTLDASTKLREDVTRQHKEKMAKLGITDDTPEDSPLWDKKEVIDEANRYKEFNDKLYGKEKELQKDIKTSSDVDTTKTAAAAAETFLNAATLGTGTAAKAAGKGVVKSIVKGVGEGATFGAAAGTTDAIVNDKNVVEGALQGAAFGGLVGGASSGIGAGINKAKNATGKSKLADQEAAERAEDIARTTQPNEVVQVVNPTTGEKTFYRIPASQRDQVVNAIDGTDGGIAGIPQDGKVTHVTAKSPEQMAELGFKDGGVYGDDTVNPVGTAVENVATPAGQAPADPAGLKESRYVSTTLPESDFVGAETKKKLGAEYEATTNAQRADTSLKQLDAEGVDAFSTKVYGRLDGKQITDQTVFDAQAAAQALEKVGDEGSLQRAADIYNKLSGHLSRAGQTIQAASIMARQSPQGLSYYAQKQFKEHGVKLSAEKQQQLNELINAVKEAPAKSDEMALARDNVQYFIAQNLPATVSDKIVNFWRAGLLTSPTTTGGALVGNIAQTLSRKLITNPTAAAADLIQSIITKERAQTFARAGEAGRGAIEGAKNTIGSKQYWKTGYNPMDAGQDVGKFDQKNRMLNYGDSLLGKATGRYVNGVYQVMGAADQPFRGAARRESLSSQANAAIKTQKLKGQEAKDFYKEFMANPPTDALERAQKEADYNTFQNDTALYSIVQGAKNNLRAKGMNKTAAFVDFLAPFTKVPSAVAARIIDQTPVGAAREITKQIIRVRKGEKWDQRAVSRAIGEGTMALPILGAGYALAQEGAITGGYPSTKEERDRWAKEGKQPNSIKVGDRWYSMNYIQPFGTIMALGAGISDATKAGGDIGQIVSQGLASGGKSFINQSFLQGISSGLDAVNNPVEFAGRYAANTAAGVIPNIIRSGVRAADPVQRETEGVVAGLMGGIPGLREQLPVKIDDEGNPIEAKDNFANQFFNPLKPSRSTPDEDTLFYDKAVKPASQLKTIRKREIDDLLSKSRVSAAQRKIDEYNQEVAKLVAPYVKEYGSQMTEDQIDRLDKLFLGEVWINSKNRPTVSSRSDLPE